MNQLFGLQHRGGRPPVSEEPPLVGKRSLNILTQKKERKVWSCHE